MAGGIRCAGRDHPAKERPAGVAVGGMPVGGRSEAAHRGGDLATEGLLRFGTPPGQDPRRTIDPPGCQSGCLHLRAIAQRSPRTTATSSRRSHDLSNCTASVLGTRLDSRTLFTKCLERVMNSAEKPHRNANLSVSSVLRRSPVFRISKLFLSKFITAPREIVRKGVGAALRTWAWPL